MARRRSARLPILAVLAATALAGCGPGYQDYGRARPTGDFGRARPSVFHDDILPKLDSTLVAGVLRGESVSTFNLTDTEEELRDRSWAFVRPPHVGDWWLDFLVERQRTRLLPVVDPTFDPARYHAFLRGETYASSEARWTKVIADMTGDALLVPPFCAVAARVRRTDAERLAAATRSPAVDAVMAGEAADRVAENDAVMAWVWRALAYRLTAYRIAIDRLAVETPSDQLLEANRTFDALAATRCHDAPAARTLPAPAGRASRMRDGPDPFDQPVLQK